MLGKDEKAPKVKVAVLLATSAPKIEHLKSQLDSISNQEAVEVHIFWGDSKSTIKKKDMVRSLLKPFEFTLIDVGSASPSHNFFKLLVSAKGFDYYAFCDQDDIWFPKKLISSINVLRSSEAVPAATHSRSMLLKDSEMFYRHPICHSNHQVGLLSENCCQGHTLVFNAKLRTQLLESDESAIIYIDWLVGLIAAYLGHLHFLSEPDTIYRLHGENHIGIPTYCRRVRNYFNGSSRLGVIQVRNFFTFYQEQMSSSSLKHLEQWQSMFSGSLAKRLGNIILTLEGDTY